MYDFAHEDHPATAAAYGTPPLVLTAAEALRFPVELGSSLVSDLVWLPSTAERGRPVLVIPGFMADDPLTARLRGHLGRRGYDPHPWGQGRNVGLIDPIIDGLLERFDEIAAAHPSEQVSVVGWSFGGLLARWLAHRRTDRVRQVVCLGSPWRADGERTRATRMFEASRRKHGLSDRARDIVDELRQPLPVRATAVWSRTDGIAHWKGCRLDDGPLTENVAVPSSHVGLVSNPLALAVVDDRLDQDLADWQPFSWSRCLTRRALGDVA